MSRNRSQEQPYEGAHVLPDFSDLLHTYGDRLLKAEAAQPGVAIHTLRTLAVRLTRVLENHETLHQVAVPVGKRPGSRHEVLELTTMAFYEVYRQSRMHGGGTSHVVEMVFSLVAARSEIDYPRIGDVMVCNPARNQTPYISAITVQHPDEEHALLLINERRAPQDCQALGLVALTTEYLDRLHIAPAD